MANVKQSSEDRLFSALKHLLMAASTRHAENCCLGWATCTCALAEALRGAEKELFRVNNKRILANKGKRRNGH